MQLFAQKEKTMENRKANALINETSPYLLQHAYNPVQWNAWNDETLARAKKEGKLLLISIGYSSCHWCHVMEHESFENEEVAAFMNKYFINVKVDREERPDVDQIYMTAVQLITGSGGWPLNCIALPDGRPVWGGTYFRKDQWMNSLRQVAEMYENNPEKIEEYAQNLLEGIVQNKAIAPTKNEAAFSQEIADAMFVNMSRRFDKKNGGPDKAPKFPMPGNYEFLLNYGVLRDDPKALAQVELTLDKMAQGGIYDQIGGGFARYSTDVIWKAPHFEKMLYDNAQLISLYSKGFMVFGKAEYKTVVCETIDFLEREMRGSKGQFYSALDADSEGEEGLFYVWKPDELQDLLGEDWALFQKYYNVNNNGAWEGSYILLRRESDSAFAEEHEMNLGDLEAKVKTWKKTLLKARAKRVRPGLDDKALTSWNALMIKGFVDAYVAINENDYLKKALHLANFIEQNLRQPDGHLLHSYKNNISKIDGFLEDYALLAEAYIKLYEVSGDEKWLHLAEADVKYAIKYFQDPNSVLFYFTSAQAKSLVANNIEKEDNVIPSSNAVMATNLFYLSRLSGNLKYEEQATEMLKYLQDDLARYPGGYTQWGQLLLNITFNYYEIAVVGKQAESEILAFRRSQYQPNIVWAFAEKESEVELLQSRYVKGETLIYVCESGVCKLPVKTIEEAVRLLSE